MKTAVIGAANIDITATPNAKYIPNDSNPGKITYSLGGVGRNIAHNLSLLGFDVSFLTAIGGDLHAKTIIENCELLGISLTHARFCPEMSSSLYVCVNDEHGDLVAGINDMEICKMVTKEYIEGNLSFLNSCDSVVFDTNLSEDTIRFITSNCTASLFADTVSVTKAKKLGNIMKDSELNMFSLKANRIEAAAICGFDLDTNDDIRKCAGYFHSHGVMRAYITLGADGIFVSDGNVSSFLPCPDTEIVNATGSGDSFLAALVLGKEYGYDALESAKLGQAAAKITLSSEFAVSPLMSRSLINEEYSKI